MQQTVKGSLPVFIFKDEFGYFSAFSPALNLAGQGRDKESAVESFKQVVEIFLEETARKGTLPEILNGKTSDLDSWLGRGGKKK